MADVRRLPGPGTDHWQWQVRALCRGLDSAMFFHPEHERGEARRRCDHDAKSLCRRCPVQLPCQTHALAVQEPYGVWGGLSAEDREVLLHPARPVRTTDVRTTDVRTTDVRTTDVRTTDVPAPR